MAKRMPLTYEVDRNGTMYKITDPNSLVGFDKKPEVYWMSKQTMDELVYIPKTGKKFHYDANCQKAVEVKETVPAIEAHVRGYSSCSHCRTLANVRRRG